jgi:hypothetical protein
MNASAKIWIGVAQIQQRSIKAHVQKGLEGHRQNRGTGHCGGSGGDIANDGPLLGGSWPAPLEQHRRDDRGAVDTRHHNREQEGALNCHL